MADNYDCLDFLHPVHRFSPPRPYTFSHPDPPSPPVLPGDLTSLRSSTPELQYLVSLTATPSTQATLEAAHVLARNQDPLHILSNAASLVHSAPVFPSNALGLYFNPPISPLLLPTHQNADEVAPTASNPREESSANDKTLSSSSSSYHVRSPTLSPPQVSGPSRLSPPGPCPSPADPHPPSPPDQEETRLDNQENCPPTPLAPLPLDPYAPPACAQFVHPYHPHQFLILRHEDRDIWRPVPEACYPNLIGFPTATDLVTLPPQFPSVISFKVATHHATRLSPVDSFQAATLRVAALAICAHASLLPPTPDLPLGYICFTYHPSLRATLQNLPHYACLCFSGTLAVTDVFDFLDGRRIISYSYIGVDPSGVGLSNQTCHLEDAARLHHHLLRYTLAPRLPLDPLPHVCVVPDGLL